MRNTNNCKPVRESYPVGTVFCSRVCELQGGFYAAGDLYPMDINMGDYKSEAHRPTADMVRAYKEYKDTQVILIIFFAFIYQSVGFLK